ncbi:MAG: methionine--tRNA ligase subunit beta [Patescibacteria group bacterium]|mgnify:FL=1
MINYEDFSKTELRTAKVLEASRVDGSEKLLKLILDAGDKDESGVLINRQVIAGIGKSYEPENLVGKQIVIVANLEPRQLMGLESNGMILAASDENGIAVLMPDKEVNPGSGIK